MKNEDVCNTGIVVKIPNGFKKHMDKLRIPEKNQTKVFEDYIHFLLGTYYGEDVTSFIVWTEQSDNISNSY